MNKFVDTSLDFVHLLDEAPRAAASSDTLIHHAADAHLTKFKTAVQYAFAKGRAAVDRFALKRATTHEAAMAAMAGVPAAVHDALLEVLPKTLLNCFVDGGHAGVRMLALKLKAASLRTAAPQVPGQPHTVVPPFNLAFNVNSPNAIAYAQAHAGDLAQGISDTTREDIQDTISAALEGDGLDVAYKAILDSVGDESRAEMISRTEVMDAANQGQLESWSQAIDAGFLTGDEKKEWIATAGDNTCEDCQDLDGEQVGIDDVFSSGDDAPPAHPSCRCSLGIAGGTIESEE
jgi:SPP1 gp7 family putative phage head morphogenesis protein